MQTELTSTKYLLEEFYLQLELVLPVNVILAWLVILIFVMAKHYVTLVAALTNQLQFTLTGKRLTQAQLLIVILAALLL
jgi:hypothetical protein